MKPVYGLCDVKPNFHLSNDVYHMWTFAENDGELELPEELATHVRMVPWHEHSSDVVAMVSQKHLVSSMSWSMKTLNRLML